MTVLELYVSSSCRIRSLFETSVMSLELVDALRLVDQILRLAGVIRVQLVVGVSRELEETSILDCLATLTSLLSLQHLGVMLM